MNQRLRTLALSVVIWGGGALAVASGAPVDIEQAATRVRELISAKEFETAERRARELLVRMESLHGENAVEVTAALDLLLRVLWSAGNLSGAEAVEIADRILRIQEQRFGAESIEVATALNRRGVVSEQRGEYRDARRYHERSLAIREAILPPEDVRISTALNNLGGIAHRLREYDAELRLLTRAVEIREAALGRDSARLVKPLQGIANALERLGRYEESLAYYRRAVAIAEAEYGIHRFTAEAVNNMGTWYLTRGEHQRALELFERSLEIWQEALGANHREVARSLHNLGVVRRILGDSREARRLWNRALKIRVRAMGADHPDVGKLQNNLGNVLLDMGKLGAAERAFGRARVVLEAGFGHDDPTIATNLAGQARLFLAREQYDRAQSFSRQDLELRRRIHGRDHVATADALVLASRIALARQRPEEALAMSKEAAEILRRNGGSMHGSLPLASSLQAESAWRSGAANAAFDYAVAAESSARLQFRSTSRALSERQMLLYDSKRVGGLDLTLSVLTDGGGQNATQTRRAFDEVVRSRALILDELASRPSISTYDSAPANDYGRALSILTGLLNEGPDLDGPVLYRRRVEGARRAMENAEIALLRESFTYRAKIRRSEIGLDDVAASLPERSALVSYVVYDRRHRDPATGRSGLEYGAFILSGASADPGWVPLGAAARIDRLVGTWKQRVSRLPTGAPIPGGRVERDYRKAADALRRAVWDPVAARIGPDLRVFIVPDGMLNLVSFATFPDGDDGYLVETRPPVHYLSAERDLVRDRVWKGENSLLAMGGPRFDQPPAERVLRSATRSCTGRKKSFEPLPGAVREVERIAELWPSGESVDVRIGARATEEAFKTLAPRRRVVHLATHGFIVDRGCATSTNRRSRPGESPLMLAGLALAGANLAQDEPRTEDGVLTAEEIAALDLRRVQWAVLSACDTGVGSVRAGEGVSGLRRAFQTAGAGTLVMSLWPVDDEATRDWMIRLYEARRSGASTLDAVRRASVRTLSARRDAGESTHPFFWGAFVAAGDWR